MLMSVSNFTQQLGGLRQSFSTDYAEKQKKDSLSILQAGEPNMREGGEKVETGLGAVAGMAKLGDSLGKVREKAMKAKGAIQRVRTAVSDARNVASGSATQDKSLTTPKADSAGATPDTSSAPAKAPAKPLSNTPDDGSGRSVNIAKDLDPSTTPASAGKASLGEALDASAKRSNIKIGTKGVAPPTKEGSVVDSDLFGKSNGSALQDLRTARPRGSGMLNTLDSRAGGVSRSVKMVGMGEERGASLGSKMSVRGSLTGGGDSAGNDMLGKLGSMLQQHVGATLGAKGANAPTAMNAHAMPTIPTTTPTTTPATPTIGGKGGVETGGGGGGGDEDLMSRAGGFMRNAVGDDTMNMGSRIAGVASKGLEAGASVLDALGPIGDILGIGMAVFGGIEQHREKKEAMESSQGAESQVKNDVAPTNKGLVASTNVSLDTSKGTSAGVASHY